jgi:hypothetical protein
MSQLFLNHFNLCTKKMQNPFLLNLGFLFFNRKDAEAAKFFILNLTLFIPLIALSVQQSRIEFSILLCTLCGFSFPLQQRRRGRRGFNKRIIINCFSCFIFKFPKNRFVYSSLRSLRLCGFYFFSKINTNTLTNEHN